MMKRISITIDEADLKWVKDAMKAGRFASISHAVRYAVQELRVKEAAKP